MSVVVQNLGHWQNLFAYGLGYALGNFLGIYIEEINSIKLNLSKSWLNLSKI
mgnify:CR=1 FL=1|jgi:hypothetical protein